MLHPDYLRQIFISPSEKTRMLVNDWIRQENKNNSAAAQATFLTIFLCLLFLTDSGWASKLLVLILAGYITLIKNLYKFKDSPLQEFDRDKINRIVINYHKKITFSSYLLLGEIFFLSCYFIVKYASSVDLSFLPHNDFNLSSEIVFSSGWIGGSMYSINKYKKHIAKITSEMPL